MTSKTSLFTDPQGRPAIRTEVVINAPLPDVWAIATDFAAMPSWSSTFQGLDGPFEKNGDVTAIFSIFGRETRITHPLIHWEDTLDRKMFGWSAPTSERGNIIHDHRYIAERIGSNQTLFIQTDAFVGMPRLLSSVVLRLIRRWYIRFNLELKKRIEMREKPRLADARV